MGIIVKPTTFTAGATKSGEAAQVNADYDTIYSEFNGNIDNANIKSAAAIEQSKIASLVTDIASIGVKHIQTLSASASATVDFTSGLSSTYNHYIITISTLIPATDNTDLWIRFSQSASFLAGASDYSWMRAGAASGAGVWGFTEDSADNQIIVANSVSNVGGRSLSHLWMLLSHPASAKQKSMIAFTSYPTAAGPSQYLYCTGTLELNSAAIDGVRFLMSSGNITSGSFSLYGLKK